MPNQNKAQLNQESTPGRPIPSYDKELEELEAQMLLDFPELMEDQNTDQMESTCENKEKSFAEKMLCL